MKLYDVHHPAFAAYGRVLSVDSAALLREADKIERPQSGSAYLASVPALEQLPIMQTVVDVCFGTLDTQLGFCHGHNDRLNALEWHICPEFNLATTDLVLLLGKPELLQNGPIDAKDLEAFHLRRGDAVQIDAGVLHFCPIGWEPEGFGCVVGLLRATNLPLTVPSSDARLFRQNKWLLAHTENAPLIARGAIPGVTGKNLTLADLEEV